MKKIIFIITSLLFSFNVYATTLSQSFSSAVFTAMNHSDTSVKVVSSIFPMVYGGQDISRSRVATANESMWSGQPVLIG